MGFLKHFDKKKLKYNLLNKFFYNDTKKLPEIKKIILNFGCKNTKLKNLSSSILALELITLKKGVLTKTKHSNILLKIRKGNPVGCKVILKNEIMYNFLERFINEILPKMDEFKTNSKDKKIKNSYYYRINDTFTFSELEKNYYLFNELNYLDINIIVNSTLKKDMKFLLSSFKLNKS
jgi:large subunit ribosomal protein L5